MFGEDNAPLSVQHGEKVIDGIEREREEKLATLVSSQGEREREGGSNRCETRRSCAPKPFLSFPVLKLNQFCERWLKRSLSQTEATLLGCYVPYGVVAQPIKEF